ncbi:MAG: ATP-dependent helicase HrpB [Candidatus Thiodiazotropha weberae]|nr:ATP-dependent helicase HrpB [Candidatus Thiodiazotropha weberae]
MTELPVQQVIYELSETLATQGRAVLSAPPGSGKTTLVPLELLNSPWLDGNGILLLEPRRLAARAAAARMASLLGEQIGERVGYSIRLERKVSRNTRIEVVTEGILTRRLQQDPELPGVGLVIFDEFHERNLHSDLSLALTLDTQQGLREDLRLLVMSATLDQHAVSRLLRDAAVIQAQGRQYPITHHYLDQALDKTKIAEQAVKAIIRAWQNEQGDILVFLPGVGEIRSAQKLLEAQMKNQNQPVLISPLYGDLSKDDQDRAILPDPHKRRRIVLTTSIAETSLTIEGITVVVDGGWSRMPRFLPAIGLTRLETVPVSKAAADQRAGRAGRLGPGVCYRICSESAHNQSLSHHPAEILQTDLAPVALQLASWGIADPAQLQWLDPPPKGAFAQAVTLLQRLGAVDQQGMITRLGRRMAELPTHPRLAHMLIHAPGDQLQLVSDLVALITERDPLSIREDGSDLALRLTLLQQWREKSLSESRYRSACRHIDRISRDWLRRLRISGRADSNGLLSAGELLALAFPDRIAQRSAHGRYRLVTGRAVRLAEDDPLAGEEYLVAVQLDAGLNEGRIRLAASIGLKALHGLPEITLEERSVVCWERKEERVRTSSETCLGALVLSREKLINPDPEAVRAAMIEGVRTMGIGALPWSKAVRQWQLRVNWLVARLDDPAWPDLSDRWLFENLESWLTPWLETIQSKQQLQRLDLQAILLARLSWDQQQTLKSMAPTHLTVPSGSKIPLRYSADEAPVLAVRLQELFGLNDTPKICQGRVPVMLHLLSPAHRPIQITDDLAGFWQRTYAEVKKELKGRYPKHYWPDNPLLAEATHKAKPRKSGGSG